MTLLAVNHLSVSFNTRNGIQTAVRDVSFTVEAGQITAVIGESGSGKSVTCYSLLGLVPCPPGQIDGGSAQFKGRDLLTLSARELRKIRGREIAMVFQDPMTCLNPYMRIGAQLMEPLRLHQGIDKATAKTRAIALLDEVGILEPETNFNRFPHEFSGGMRQRVMIAMALINEPSLLIADEPTTALDVTLQAQILALLEQLRKTRNVGILLISHDLAVVADIADTIVVMRDGEVVERGKSRTVFETPTQPYTQQLLDALPRGTKRASNSVNTDAQALVRVEHLSVQFPQSHSSSIKAVNTVSLDIGRGQVVGLVGESGSGKSTLGRAILQLQRYSSGSVHFDDVDLAALKPRALKQQRRRMQIIFQDPYASLNPRMTVQQTLAEPLLHHGLATRQDVAAKVFQLMNDVGLPKTVAHKYPHEFSGGQRQRIAIGRALATRPDFVVADEPVSALDVTIQAQILTLIEQLVGEYGLTMLFISHDLAVVRQLSDHVAVMFRGEILERGETEQLFSSPKTDYTKTLLAAIPGDRLNLNRQ